MYSTYRQRYAPITRTNVHKTPQFKALPWDVQQAIRVVSAIFPFRTNAYVVDHLIDWDDVPNDPIYQLTFPQRGMVSAPEFAEIAQLMADDAAQQRLK
ncbi:MAG: lysine 2,3-aminomutase, partial [Anaerolineae bacterium]|nr:lysine 2,3-aminomutase [Anaerolineae bacterium]